MDTTVNEDTTRELGIGHEETARIELVAGLRAENGWCADFTGGHAGVCVAVGGVKAAAEAADDFLGGELFDGGFVGVDDGLGLYVG